MWRKVWERKVVNKEEVVSSENCLEVVVVRGGGRKVYSAKLIWWYLKRNHATDHHIQQRKVRLQKSFKHRRLWRKSDIVSARVVQRDGNGLENNG